SPAPCTIPHARGTMLRSSGLRRPPNGRPYSIPTKRSAAASPSSPPNVARLPQLLPRRDRARGGETALSPERKNDRTREPKEGARGGTMGSPTLGSPALNRRRCATDELGDLLRLDEHRVDARALERDHVVPRCRLKVGVRKLACRHIWEKVEDPVEVVLVVLGVAAREQED